MVGRRARRSHTRAGMPDDAGAPRRDTSEEKCDSLSDNTAAGKSEREGGGVGGACAYACVSVCVCVHLRGCSKKQARGGRWESEGRVGEEGGEEGGMGHQCSEYRSKTPNGHPTSQTNTHDLKYTHSDAPPPPVGAWARRQQQRRRRPLSSRRPLCPAPLRTAERKLSCPTPQRFSHTGGPSAHARPAAAAGWSKTRQGVDGMRYDVNYRRDMLSMLTKVTTGRR